MYTQLRTNMCKRFILWVVLGSLGGCVSPGEDAANASNCELLGLQKGSENHKICRQWLNADLIAASDNYIFAPKRTFSDFACLDYHKTPEGSSEYLKCHEKYKQIAEQGRQYYMAQQEKTLKAVLDADQQKCGSYGLKKGTAEFADCMMKQEAQRKADVVINEALQLEKQKLASDNYYRHQMMAIEKNKEVESNSINCHTTYNRWGANTNCQ